MNSQLKTALEQLAVAREQLFSFADDVWLDIDHRDPNQRQQGVACIDEYEEKMKAFGVCCGELFSEYHSRLHDQIAQRFWYRVARTQDVSPARSRF